jgi:transcription-repair coupling factor (superfamily II helicase)
MSVLEEAPIDRVPVQTFVLEHDEDVIFEAIRRELRRGGQVFYLHNFVDSIYSKATSLKNAFPDANIAVGHGKMDKEQLSDVWTDMVEGNVDILVSTTIIESGVNVPNANTLIIEDADRMGLSQLHQIRGRVGRSTRKAYAYLTYKSGSVINEVAEKRLEAIREFTEFGSGFKIAMRDLEIRGAGNLLGAEQSGHLEAIGYDLYIKILEDAINAEKGIAPKAEKNCTIEVTADAYIPEEYISSLSLRIDVYKKIAAVSNRDEFDDLIDELNDRFGEIPTPITNLIRISHLRNMAMNCDFTSIEQNGRVIGFYNPNINIERCSVIASEDPFRGAVMISLGGRPHIAYKLREGEKILDMCEKIIERYSKLEQN